VISQRRLRNICRVRAQLESLFFGRRKSRELPVHDYRLGDRVDLNELLSFSANYRSQTGWRSVDQQLCLESVEP